MTTFKVTVPAERVVKAAILVPQGPAGAPGAPGGAGEEHPAAVAVSGHAVVALDAAGALRYASADVAADALLVAGVSVNAAAPGGTVSVRSAGLVTHAGWAWTPGAPVYLGLNGALTQSIPVTAVFARVIGNAVSSDSLLIDLQPPVFLD